MAHLTYTLGIILITAISGPAKADASVNTATDNCWEEAVSTGLEDETDIIE